MMNLLEFIKADSQGITIVASQLAVESFLCVLDAVSKK